MRGAVIAIISLSTSSSNMRNKQPAVKSQPIPRAAEMYSVTPQNEQVCGFSASAKTTAASTEICSVFPKWKLNS